jgi:hypothetical protein
VVRDLGDLDNTLSVTDQWPHLLGRQILLLPSTTNSPNKTLPQWKMSTVSCSSISHIQTWLKDNTILINLPDSTLHPYTTILHSAAHFVKRLRPRDHITLALWQLHWLPILARISFKICVHIFNIHFGLSPRYMSSLVMPCKSRIEIESLLICQRRLRNPAHVQLIWSTCVCRCWSIQSPCLPPSRVIYQSFKTKLKLIFFKFVTDNI